LDAVCGVLEISAIGDLLGMPPEQGAPLLIGCVLTSTVGGSTIRARVTEVEAYKGSDDPASHAFRGRTKRNGSMFERAGTLYVYRSYGIHLCANVSVGPEGTGWAVLFRAAGILDGEGVARSRRGRADHLTDGPGKLTQALGIRAEHDGVDLLSSTSEVRLESGAPSQVVVATPRVGISQAQDRLWRFVEVSSATPVG
jgi:DNA-3-methyladenine glycosylase